MDYAVDVPRTKVRSFPDIDVASRWFQLAAAALHGGADAKKAIDCANAVSTAYEESYDALGVAPIPRKVF